MDEGEEAFQIRQLVKELIEELECYNKIEVNDDELEKVGRLLEQSILQRFGSYAYTRNMMTFTIEIEV